MTPTQSFEDAKGRKWELRVTAGHAVDLKAAGININKALTDPSWVGVLVDDVALLVAALHIVCNPTSKGVSPEDFNDGLDGSTLEAAATALALAIVGFFPRSKIAGA
ncbi:MAG TPA: hypothetical protein VD866_31285, partial [Urbifossiella sp.]|nr:hypothetical protein [Urbifossiella sp.]